MRRSYLVEKLCQIQILAFLISFIVFTSSCKKNDAPAINPNPPADTSLQLFQLTDLPQLYLEISQPQWDTLLRNFDTNPMNEEYIISDYRFVLGGKNISLDSMGIRIRGNTSRRRPEGSTGQMHNTQNPDWHHAHFALSFSKYRKKQRFNGIEKINLKWFKDDANYVREIYCYDLFKRYGVWTAPKASYCRLIIHIKGDPQPANFGVYSMIESIDEDYIVSRKEKWGADTGYLWKGGWAGSLNANMVQTTSIGVEDVKLDPALSKYYAYDLKTKKKELSTAKAQLVTFIQELNSKTGNEFEQWIAQKMDVPLFLKTYAVNVIVGMWDDYWANGNNYYFYFDKAGKAWFIPYDYDNTLGTSYFFNAGTQDLLQWGNMTDRPLVTKILQIVDYRNLYKSYLKELAGSSLPYFNYTASLQRINKWQQLVNNYVFNDTGEDMYIEDKPAPWGNVPLYRLKSGNDLGGANGEANFFSTKAKQITW
ncbi:MAG: CotH kinase family protein [Chitinophagaceae bacterium]|nr:CotH kinase family protein [Chitinophagaceae bacterium]